MINKNHINAHQLAPFLHIPGFPKSNGLSTTFSTQLASFKSAKMDSTSCHNEKVSFENNKNSVIGKGKLLSLRFQEVHIYTE